jgi:hypothetical protein
MPATGGTKVAGSTAATNALITGFTSGAALIHQVVAANGSGGLVIEPLRKSVALVYNDYDIQDYDDLVVCNKSTAMNVNLPEAIGSGAVHIIKNIGAGTVTVLCSVYDLLDSDVYLGGADSEDIEQWECLTVCDCMYGLWIVVGRVV